MESSFHEVICPSCGKVMQRVTDKRVRSFDMLADSSSAATSVATITMTQPADTSSSERDGGRYYYDALDRQRKPVAFVDYICNHCGTEDQRIERD